MHASTSAKTPRVSQDDRTKPAWSASRMQPAKAVHELRNLRVLNISRHNFMSVCPPRPAPEVARIHQQLAPIATTLLLSGRRSKLWDITTPELRGFRRMGDYFGWVLMIRCMVGTTERSYLRGWLHCSIAGTPILASRTSRAGQCQHYLSWAVWHDAVDLLCWQ